MLRSILIRSCLSRGAGCRTEGREKVLQSSCAGSESVCLKYHPPPPPPPPTHRALFATLAVWGPVRKAAELGLGSGTFCSRPW